MVHDYDFVEVKDSVKFVCDGNNSMRRELGAKQLLNMHVGVVVETVRRSVISFGREYYKKIGWEESFGVRSVYLKSLGLTCW